MSRSSPSPTGPSWCGRARARCAPTGWLALLALVLHTVACTQGRAAPSAGQRVVSLSPNTTETVFALGAGAQLVGRSRYCDFPAEATSRPVVGGFADPSVEAILALRPTLVVGARGPAGPGLAEALGSRGIETYFPAIESVADILAMVRGLGQRLGRTDQAAALAGRIERDVARLAAEAARQPRVRAVLGFDASPIVVAGPGGFPDELLRLAGADNVIDEGGAYPTVGLERLLALDPDVIIDASAVGTGEDSAEAAGPSQLPKRPGWSRLRAVRQGWVPSLTSSTALRPGPRIAQGLAEIGRALRTREAAP